MDWSGVYYCDVLSAVWTLILTAPIHCRDSIDEWCNAKILQICSVEETNSSISCMAWEWVHFLQMFIIGWTISRAKYKIICYVTKKDPRIFETWLLIVRLIIILCAILIAADWSYPFFSCFSALVDLICTQTGNRTITCQAVKYKTPFK